MSRHPFITFFSLFYAVSISNVTAQICDSISLDSTQKKLYLNGSNFTLIDNALRCFKLNSIAGVKDSLVRIWMLDDNYPDSPLDAKGRDFLDDNMKKLNFKR